MTLIKMLQTRKGSEDGFTVRQFVEGKIYDVRENLARSFFSAGFAKKAVLDEPKTNIKGKKPKKSKK